MPTTKILVLVPINVQVPPKIEAKLRGIRNLETETLWRLAQSCSNGIKIATTGVLLIIELIKATGNITRGIARLGSALRPSHFIIHQCNAPLSFNAAETI